MFIMLLSILGSIFLLLAEFPYAPVKNFFANIGWAPAMYQANNATMGIMAAVAAVTIPYSFAKNEKLEPLSAGVAGIVSFMLRSEERRVGKECRYDWVGTRSLIKMK